MTLLIITIFGLTYTILPTAAVITKCIQHNFVCRFPLSVFVQLLIFFFSLVDMQQ